MPDTNPDAVKLLTDDERLDQIRARQSYRAEWAYGDDIEFLLSLNTALREQLADAIKTRDLFVSLKRGQTERADELYTRALELLKERDELQSQLAQVTQEQAGQSMSSEALVREWANFHPDIPLTKTYADLVRRIATLRGCSHCSCVCVTCAPCGEKEQL